MTDMNRRAFLRRTMGAVAAGTVVAGGAGAAGAGLTASTVRPLGKTGLSCSLLGIGTGTHGRNGTTDQTRLPKEELVSLLEYAYSKGITFLDMADMYGSHPHVREALKRSVPRDKVMLLTKTWSRKPEEVGADIERFRSELDTDVLDVVLLHCLRGGEDDWPEKHKAAMDVMADAKAKGAIRAHGVSCHNLEALRRAAETDWVDVALVRINPHGLNMDGTVDDVVPIIQKLHDNGKGVLGMKILAEGVPRGIDDIPKSLEFVTGLGTVDAMTIGFMDTQQLDSMTGYIAAL